MSAHSELEKKYRRQGNDVLADAVLALLGTEEKDGKLVSCLAMRLEPYLQTNENIQALCENIFTMLENEKILADELEYEYLVNSSDYFSKLRKLQLKYCGM